MSELEWRPDPDDVYESDAKSQMAFSGEVVIGSVRMMVRSGRWRWAVAALPDDTLWDDSRKGWALSEDRAKAEVQDQWTRWCARAALSRARGEKP